MKEGEYEDIYGPEDLINLIKSLLKVKPDDRITYSEIKELPFLKEYFDAHKSGTLLEFKALKMQE